MSGESVDLAPAFVLHARPYQETSLVLEVMSSQFGRLGMVARGARRPASRLRSILQPFAPVRLSWFGRGSLHTLRAAETAGYETPLEGVALMGAFYLNELILSFVRRGDPHPGLFAAYAQALAELRVAGDPEPALRCFEMRLLAEVGYGLNLEHDALNDLPLDPAALYEYRLEQGPVPVVAGGGTGHGGLTLSGAQLAAIARLDFRDPGVLRLARRLLRTVLAHYLDGRSLKTREVLAAMRRPSTVPA